MLPHDGEIVLAIVFYWNWLRKNTKTLVFVKVFGVES